ncbi:hypothetical protein JW766_01755 [Candidatus Dojkabacteria bacterium]|nr:hypothetical protein [Candidatus Dojkabacteria bacterium]
MEPEEQSNCQDVGEGDRSIAFATMELAARIILGLVQVPGKVLKAAFTFRSKEGGHMAVLEYEDREEEP